MSRYETIVISKYRYEGYIYWLIGQVTSHVKLASQQHTLARAKTTLDEPRISVIVDFPQVVREKIYLTKAC
jgi:hypothetical protein